MRFDRQSKSLHYFNVFAVQDRTDTSYLSENHETPPSLQFRDFLPTDDNYATLKENFKTLVSRMLCQHMKFFMITFVTVLHHTFLIVTQMK
jgi:hypothetical protein